MEQPCLLCLFKLECWNVYKYLTNLLHIIVIVTSSTRNSINNLKIVENFANYKNLFINFTKYKLLSCKK